MTTPVPPGRYRVIYSTSSAGGHSDFSAADDEAAWADAERSAYGARIIQLMRVRVGNPDRVQILARPAPDPEPSTGLYCTECGEEMWVEESGVSHHWGNNADDIDYDADGDHVAFAEQET